MIEEIFNVYLGILDSILFPLLLLKPVLTILLISIVFTIASIGISILGVDRKMLKQVRERMLMLQEELKTAQKRMDNIAMSKLTKEVMQVNLQMLKLKSKSMVTIFIIFAVFLPWLNYHYGGMSIVKLPFFLPVIGSSMGWILWYIFTSLTISYLIQKLFGIEYV